MSDFDLETIFTLLVYAIWGSIAIGTLIGLILLFLSVLIR